MKFSRKALARLDNVSGWSPTDSSSNVNANICTKLFAFLKHRNFDEIRYQFSVTM